ncbi:MAG: Crp/Fnr family transcriptional regulator [Mucilaginibacter sp.]
MYPQLLAHIKRYVSLTPQEEILLCEKMELLKFKKKEFLLEPGKLCKGNYFVLSGLVRQYLITNKLIEQIVQFGLESWWITDQESLANKQPSAYYLQTVEASEILLLTEQNRELLCEAIPRLESYFRIMMQRAFVAMQRRVGFMLNYTDEERYRYFADQFPGFMQRVPQYMLASYLGFTPQFLSRIRAKKA